MENSVPWEVYVKNARMGNMDEIEEVALDLSTSGRTSTEEIYKPKRMKIADDAVVAATNEYEASNFAQGSSGLSSFPKYYSANYASNYFTNVAGSSLDVTPSCSYTYKESVASPIFLKPNHDFISPELHLSLSNAAGNANGDVLQKKGKISVSDSMMSNAKFYSLLEPLQEKINEASVRIQSLICSRTEADLETVHGSSLFAQFKQQLAPYMNAMKNAVDVIPKVLQDIPTNYVEIMGDSKKYLICQSTYARAVSKACAKEAALVLVECDAFIPRIKKLTSTIGRTSICAVTGQNLRPLENDQLTAIYKIIANKRKMMNIQRVESYYNESPDDLTRCERKTVRDALSQYLNQLRQREKRKRLTVNPDSQDTNPPRCMSCK